MKRIAQNEKSAKKKNCQPKASAKKQAGGKMCFVKEKNETGTQKHSGKSHCRTAQNCRNGAHGRVNGQNIHQQTSEKPNAKAGK